MKWTCNILNVAVGSQLQIPLLSINAVAMRGGGRDGGGAEERRDESFLFTDLSTCLCSQEIFIKGAGMLLKQLKQEGVGGCSSFRLTERKFENLSSQNKTKCWNCSFAFVFVWWYDLLNWLAIVLSGYLSCFSVGTCFFFFEYLYSLFSFAVSWHWTQIIIQFFAGFSFRLKLNTKRLKDKSLFPSLLSPSFNPLYFLPPPPPPPTPPVLDWCHRDRIQSRGRITFSLSLLQPSQQF